MGVPAEDGRAAGGQGRLEGGVADDLEDQEGGKSGGRIHARGGNGGTRGLDGVSLGVRAFEGGIIRSVAELNGLKPKVASNYTID